MERKGGQGDMPSASQFLQVSTCKKLGGIEAYGRPYAVLAIFGKLPVGSLRVVRA